MRTQATSRKNAPAQILCVNLGGRDASFLIFKLRAYASLIYMQKLGTAL